MRALLMALALALALAGYSSFTAAQTAADALLAIDQHRASVVERIVNTWGVPLAKSSAYVSVDELRTRLLRLRADQLLAAGLAGTLEDVRAVIGADTPPAKPGLEETKALGDSAADVVYTPVTPCRLVETRGTFAAVYQGNGTPAHTPVPFTPNQIRSYVVQGGNGVCLTQLPGGLNAAAVQLQVFGLPTTTASGDIEILPQGATFGSTATMVYVGTIAFNTVSTTAKINQANNQISVQVRGGGANLAMDVVGYFAAPSGTGGEFFRQGGNAFGTTATLGTTDNQPLTLIMDNQPVMRYSPGALDTLVPSGSANILAGGFINSINSLGGAFSGQTIAGGGHDDVDCFEPSTGMLTRSCGNGTANDLATVSGGDANFASGLASTVAGGRSNNANGADATVAGGFGNTASGDSATVGGGEISVASGSFATIAGGGSNTASGLAATVAGGVVNAASGDDATVGGGTNNTASGPFATVAGGASNTASGTRSFAAGNRAKATATGSFVWADSTDLDFPPALSANFFAVRATGGVGFTVAVDPTTGGPTQFCNLLPGSFMWNCVSDRNMKENFVAVDGADVLRRLVAMPISSWNFKGSDPALRSLGPTAQDFFAAFHLGNDDKTIAIGNLSGVALAAIQGLHQLMEEKDARIDALERDLRAQQHAAELQQMELAQLRQTVETLLAKNGGMTLAGAR